MTYGCKYSVQCHLIRTLERQLPALVLCLRKYPWIVYLSVMPGHLAGQRSDVIELRPILLSAGRYSASETSLASVY
jgi:hypothetical protein